MRRILAFLCVSCCLTAGFFLSRRVSADDISERARKLHFSSIVLDTHDDTTQRFFSKNYDLGKRNPDGHVDIPRMREGGMNAIFFSIWIDGRILGPPAVQKALDQIEEAIASRLDVSTVLEIAWRPVALSRCVVPLVEQGVKCLKDKRLVLCLG